MSSTLIRRSALAAALLLPLSIQGVAFAQQPAGLRAQTPATAGSTEVAQEGFQAVVTPVEEDKDSSTLKLSAGGFLSQGNSRTLAFTSAADYLLRRSSSQFTQ